MISKLPTAHSKELVKSVQNQVSKWKSITNSLSQPKETEKLVLGRTSPLGYNRGREEELTTFLLRVRSLFKYSTALCRLTLPVQ